MIDIPSATAFSTTVQKTPNETSAGCLDEIPATPVEKLSLLDRMKAMRKRAEALNDELDVIGQGVQKLSQDVAEHCKQARKDYEESEEILARAQADLDEVEEAHETTKQIVNAMLVGILVADIASLPASARDNSRRLPQQRKHHRTGPRRTNGRQ